MRHRLATFAKSAKRPGLRVVRNADTAAGPELWLYDEIGFWGVTASDVAAYLSPLSGQRVTVRVNSPGGEVFDGIAIYNLIRGHVGGADVVVDGLAASAASFIAMAGETVTMSPHSRMMIHDAIAVAYGNAAELMDTAALLDDLSQNIAGIYAGKSGGDAATFRELMLAETWLSPSEALDLGLVDAAPGSDAGADGADPGSSAPPAGDGQGDSSAAAEGDLEDDAESLVDRWRNSIAYQAAQNTRGRVAAKAPHPATITRAAVPAARAASSSDGAGTLSILKGIRS